MSASDHDINITLSSSNIQTQLIYDLSETATKIALQNFEWNFMTLVYFNSTLWLGAEVFLQSYEKAVVIGRGTFFPKFVGTTRQYVLFENSVADILNTLKWMRAHEFDNTGKYIIICQSFDVQECDEIIAMHAFWEHKITNVIFLKIVENQATGFTYFPLNNNACTYDVPVRLENLTSCLDAADYQESCNLFPMKLANFNGCTLTVSTFQQLPYMDIQNGIPSGLDGDLLLLIAEKLNGSLVLLTPKTSDGWGQQEENDTWSGSFGDINNDHADFAITSAALTLNRFLSFQSSRDYKSAAVVWITHPAKNLPSYLKLTHPFQPDAQIALIISFAIVVICSLFIRSSVFFKISRKIKLEKPHSSVVFYSWMICMGLATPRLPTKTALLYIVLLWIWYCLLIRTFYQVTLISAMKANYYYQEFESIDDVIDAEYSLGGVAALKDYYIDYPSVYNRWKDVSPANVIPTLRNVSKGMEFVLAIKLEKANSFIWKEKLQVHVLPQKVVTCPIVIFFKKYSPLADAVNTVLTRLVESGLSDKLRKYYESTKFKHKTEQSIESIKLEHYTGCYAILIVGWIISFSFFVGEIFFDKICSQCSTL